MPLVTTDDEERGWVIVSGTAQEDDHSFAVDAIRTASSRGRHAATSDSD